MILIVVRHGETDGNVEERLQGVTDTPLNEKGRRQAKSVAKRLKDYDIEVIYSSPLKRALETAKEIAKFHPNVKFVVDKDIKELNLGVWEGLTIDEINKKYPGEYEKRAKDRWNHKIPGGESYKEADVRVKRFLNKVLEKRKNAIIVAHGAINKLIFKNLLKKPFEEVHRDFYHNTSVSVFDVEFKKEEWEARKIVFNCTRHLDGE